MGWCSATEIMDTALEAAAAAAQAAIAAVLGDDGADAWLAENEPEAVNNVLRPFVAKLAATLRDGDWDCIEDSDYFDQFPQEMLGHSDDEHKAWLVERIKDFADDGDTEQVVKASGELTAFLKKTGEN